MSQMKTKAKYQPPEWYSAKDMKEEWDTKRKLKDEIKQLEQVNSSLHTERMVRVRHLVACYLNTKAKLLHLELEIEGYGFSPESVFELYIKGKKT